MVEVRSFSPGQARLGPAEPVGPAGEATELRQLFRRVRNLREIAAQWRGAAGAPDMRNAMARWMRQAEELHKVTNRGAEHMSVADPG